MEPVGYKERNSVKAVIYDDLSDGRRILLIKVRERVPNRLLRDRITGRIVRVNTEVWTFVRGGVWKNETDEEALGREIMEEIGIEPYLIEIRGRLSDYEYTYNDFHDIGTAYAVRADTKNRITPNRKEDIVGYKWGTEAEVLYLLTHRWDTDLVHHLKKF